MSSETMSVEIRTPSIPGAEDGVFAKEAFAPGDVVLWL